MKTFVNILSVLLILTATSFAQKGSDFSSIEALRGHTNKVTSVTCDPSGTYLASSCEDNTIKIWEMPAGKEITTLVGHSSKVNAVSFSYDGTMMASVSKDGKLIIWKIPDGSKIKTIQAHQNGANDVEFSPKANYIVTVGNDNKGYIWDLTSNKPIASYDKHTNPIHSVSFSPDGRYVASSEGDNNIRLWRVPEGFEVTTLIDKTSTKVTAFSFSPDGSDLAAGTASGEIVIWEVPSGLYIKSLTGQSGSIISLTFGADNSLLMSASSNRTVVAYDVNSGESIATLDNNVNVNALDMSPDGTTLFAAGNDTYVHRWSTEGGGNVNVAINENTSNNTRTISDKTPPTITITEPHVTRGLKITSEEKTMYVKGTVDDESGVFEVLVNGVEAVITESGEFAAEIKLAVGENNIFVKASDTQNNIAEENFIIVRGGGQIREEDNKNNLIDQKDITYYALLIGVEKYGDPNINPLANPMRDARNLQDVLVNNYTFDKENVKLLKNPSRVEILANLQEIRNKISEKDNLLIFYAGHGYWDEEIKQGYWLPSDATKDNRANWISNGDLRDNIRGIKSAHTLLISDACFSGGIFRTRNAFSEADLAIQEVYKMPSRKGMTSGTLTEVPDESVFLQYLMKRLTNNTDKYLASQELFNSIRTAVINNSKQVPQYGEIQNAGDEGGDFIFIHK